MMTADDVVEMLEVLERAGLYVRIEGGWGVDALLGEQTRPHDDLDVIIRADQSDAVIQALRPLGFVMMLDERPSTYVLRDPTDRRIDCHLVTFRENGDAIQPSLEGGEWVFTANGLEGTGTIGGRHVPCTTPEEQSIRATDQPGERGYTPDNQDREDMRLLAERFGIKLPYPFADTPD